MKAILVSSCLAVSLYSMAQKMEAPLAENEWFLQKIPTNTARYHTNSYSYQKGIIYVSPSEAVAPVQQGRDNYAVIKVNSNGKILWQTPIAQKILGLGKLSDKLLVFYKGQEEDPVRLTLVEISSGKKLTDKLAVADKAETKEEITVQNLPDGTFSHLLVRTTAGKKKASYFSNESKSLETLKCEAVYLDEGGTVAKTTVLPVPENTYFLGSLVSRSGDLFLGFQDGDDLVMARYDGMGKFQSRLQAPLPAREKILSPQLVMDPEETKVWLAVAYTNKSKDDVHQVMSFDFAAKKVALSEAEVLGKAYARSIDLQAVDKVKKGGIKQMDLLQPFALMVTADQVIVVKEAPYTYAVGANGASRYSADGLIVSFYDKGLKHLKYIGMDRTFEAFMDLGRTVGYHLEGTKLYLTVAALSGVMAYSNVLCTVDTQAMKFDNFTLIDRGRLGRDQPIEPGATLWFDKALLVNYIVTKGAFAKDVNSVVQRITL